MSKDFAMGIQALDQDLNQTWDLSIRPWDTGSPQEILQGPGVRKKQHSSGRMAHRPNETQQFFGSFLSHGQNTTYDLPAFELVESRFPLNCRK